MQSLPIACGALGTLREQCRFLQPEELRLRGCPRRQPRRGRFPLFGAFKLRSLNRHRVPGAGIGRTPEYDIASGPLRGGRDPSPGTQGGRLESRRQVVRRASRAVSPAGAYRPSPVGIRLAPPRHCRRRHSQVPRELAHLASPPAPQAIGSEAEDMTARDRVPFRIQPMLATLVAKPFHRSGWVYEEKYDGYRILAYKEGNKVTLLSRRGNDRTRSFPEIAQAVVRLKPRTLLLDGEVVAFDRKHVSRFQLLQQGDVPLVYVVFDCLYVNGSDRSEEHTSELQS